MVKRKHKMKYTVDPNSRVDSFGASSSYLGFRAGEEIDLQTSASSSNIPTSLHSTNISSSYHNSNLSGLTSSLHSTNLNSSSHHHPPYHPNRLGSSSHHSQQPPRIPTNSGHSNHNPLHDIVETLDGAMPLDFPGIRTSTIPKGLQDPNIIKSNNASGAIMEWDSMEESVGTIKEGEDGEETSRPDLNRDEQEVFKSTNEESDYGGDSFAYDSSVSDRVEMNESINLADLGLTIEQKKYTTSILAGGDGHDSHTNTEHDDNNELFKQNQQGRGTPEDEVKEEDEETGEERGEDANSENTPDLVDLGYEDPDESFNRWQAENTSNALAFKNPYKANANANTNSDTKKTNTDNDFDDLGYDDTPTVNNINSLIKNVMKRAGGKMNKAINQNSTTNDPSKSNNSDGDYITNNFGHRNDKHNDDNDNDDVDDDDASNSNETSSYDSNERVIAFFGCVLPTCWTSRMPTCSTVSFLIAKYAPCFWLSSICTYGGGFHKYQRGTTDQMVLTRLNILCAIFTLVHILSAFWLIIVMLMPNIVERHTHESGLKATDGLEPNFWSINGTLFCIGVLGFVIFVANMVSIRVIRVVNITGALRYLWVMVWVLPFELFLVISLYDYHNVTQVWISHWWDTPAMAWFRVNFCEEGTAQTLCIVPLSSNETKWCLDNFDAMNCSQIRNEAQSEMLSFMQLFYSCNAGWGVFLIVLLFLIIHTLEKIISRPIVQKSRESNVPAWLLVPICGCAIVGSVFRYSPSSLVSVRAGTQKNSWVGIAYMFCAALFLLGAALGWFISSWSVLSSRDKRYKNISLMIFIILIFINLMVLAVIFGASIYYAFELNKHSIPVWQRGPLACLADNARSCSNCDGSCFSSSSNNISENIITTININANDDISGDILPSIGIVVNDSSSSSTGIGYSNNSNREIMDYNNYINNYNNTIAHENNGASNIFAKRLLQDNLTDYNNITGGLLFTADYGNYNISYNDTYNYDNSTYSTNITNSTPQQEELTMIPQETLIPTTMPTTMPSKIPSTMPSTVPTSTPEEPITTKTVAEDITEEIYYNYIDLLGPGGDCEICPEWTLIDVTRVLQTQSKQSATLAGIFLLYAVTALQFGFILRKHIAMYQIDYV